MPRMLLPNFLFHAASSSLHLGMAFSNIHFSGSLTSVSERRCVIANSSTCVSTTYRFVGKYISIIRVSTNSPVCCSCAVSFAAAYTSSFTYFVGSSSPIFSSNKRGGRGKRTFTAGFIKVSFCAIL